MSIKIKFTADEALLSKSLKEGEADILNKQEDIETNITRGNEQLIQNQAIVFTAQEKLTLSVGDLKAKIETLTTIRDQLDIELGIWFQNYQKDLSFIRDDIAVKMEQSANVQKDLNVLTPEFERLSNKISFLQEILDDLKKDADTVEVKARDLKKTFAILTAGISAAFGFIALAEALSETQLDRNIQAAMAKIGRAHV